jgi:hypothetical protein
MPQATQLGRARRFQSGPYRGKKFYVLWGGMGHLNRRIWVPRNLLQWITIYLPNGGYGSVQRASKHGIGVDYATLMTWATVREPSAVVVESKARGILDAWAAWLPIRIANEEIGDCLEDIARRTRAGQRWNVYVRVASCIFWSAVNALGYYYEKVGRKKAG